MHIQETFGEVVTTIYYQVLLDKEIDKYNLRVDEEEQIDIYVVRNSMNNYHDIEELKAAIEEIKNR